MRPLRLELAGFTSFREPTSIDLSDADYFVLAGPTGAGKSTVIDAICFALYGSVPRYDHKGLVAPVISQGKLEAKVCLDFSIDGRRYRAVRVVRRLAKGATTKEARLECDGEVLAGSADEVSAHVAELIGLSFEHFIKCVVLPQGEFSRFLHDRPSDRQDMVVKLLNLGVYERMRQEARSIASRLEAECEVHERRVEEDLSFATPRALNDERARLQGLKALHETVREASPRLDELAGARDSALDAAEASRAQARALGALLVPDEVVALGREMSVARSAIKDAEAEAAAAERTVAESIAARAALPARQPLEEALAAHGRRAQLAHKIEEHSRHLTRVADAEASARARRDAAVVVAEQASSAEADARDEHAAHHLARSLEPGGRCPVCRQVIDHVPSHLPPAELERAQGIAAEARAALERAIAQWDSTRTEATAAAAEASLLDSQLRELDAALAERSGASEVTQELARIEGAESALEQARAAETLARRRLADARREWDVVQETERAARQQFERRRDELAGLGPPPARREDLAEDYAELLEWGREQLPLLAERADAYEARVDEIEKERAVLMEDLERACRECGVDATGVPILEAVVAAIARSENEVSRIEQGLETARELAETIARDRERARLASELALHLSASPGRFESWIVEEALRRLVEGATEILQQLSSGQYSMTLGDSGGFFVTDHHNADERRSARTLSGGETFLASLALALALADQLAELAAEGAARLEAIFLDEGFGTLDPETLEVVAASVENLAAGGRMVGIVTHVRELAERVPVQFQVRKNDRTSTIERVTP